MISAFDGHIESRPIDKLTVLNGIITHESKYIWDLPTQQQRETMKFQIDEGVITAIGTLKFWFDQPLEETTFRGVTGTGFLTGALSDGDIVILHLTKW